MKTKRKERTCEGTYTVEAAFVFPIVFFVIIFLLNCAFYCYDKAKLKSELEDITRKAGAYMSYEIGLTDNEYDRLSICRENILWLFFGDRRPKEYMIEQYMFKRLKSGYYVTDIKAVNVSSTFYEITVSGIADVKFIGLGWMNQLLEKPFYYAFSQSRKTFPREDKARILEAAISFGSQIKGVEEAINQLAEFIGYIH